MQPPRNGSGALLDITVCDPACGSGHFLVAAARRIAKRVAAEETGESEPPDAVVRAALRRVVGRCIYGVDINPMAAELAKVSLWLEALEPGKPLSFLDQNIRVGNSLLGVTPALLADGLPDAAFTPIEGDDRKVASALQEAERGERDGPARPVQPGRHPGHQRDPRQAGRRDRPGAARQPGRPAHPPATPGPGTRRVAELREPETARRRLVRRVRPAQDRRHPLHRDHPGGPGALRRTTGHAGLGGRRETWSQDLTRQYRFFHWHVEFPHIFRVGNGATDIDPATGWSGGFSCVIGNPPWERVKLQEQEFFAAREPEIANAPNAAARKKLIAALADSDSPADQALFTTSSQAELRKAAGWSHLLRESGRYPLTGRGDINTYAVFAETARTVIGADGRSGLVLPTGIATDATTAPFFSDLVRNSQARVVPRLRE